MKITRKYASRENAVDARMIIQDLIISEFEMIVDQSERPSTIKNTEMYNGGIQ
ncbi:hypothetical protein ABER02_08185 [Rossellomorea marisflavi]|uniref:hypothetical protein n=1 Tax=Rossellomorea marisflavi TaxID=189381 RepID=UPI003D2CA19A